jgi:hypothetical protein
MPKKRKRNKHSTLTTAVALVAVAASLDNVDDDESTDDGMVVASTGIITPQEVAVAVRVISQLAAEPGLLVFQSPLCRQLRQELHPLILDQLRNKYQVPDYGLAVTKHLKLSQWPEAAAALVGLKDMSSGSLKNHQQHVPKRGTIQRWVRDCDDAPGTWKMRLLSAIVSLEQETSSSPVVDTNRHDPGQQLAQAAAASTDVELQPPWEMPSATAAAVTSADLDLQQSQPQLVSRIIHQEAAADRLPPNHHDLLLHYTEPGSCMLYNNSNDSNDTQVVKTEIPFVKGGFVLSGVLSPAECRLLRDAAETLGFRPDHPLAAEKPTGIDSCEWFVDDSILAPMYGRVRAFLPPPPLTSSTAAASMVCTGLNARWRFFRYAETAVYRPHIDGSWPESRLDKETGAYVSCTDTHTDAARSYYTFLIYLNDDFEGGETVFYYGANGQNGMAARGVTPKQGSVVCFPQGNSASLIHEGSAVRKGTKYVVRTDVLYRAAKSDMEGKRR